MRHQSKDKTKVLTETQKSRGKSKNLVGFFEKQSRKEHKHQQIYKSVFRIRIGMNADLDPAF
jgi:hypothetical protein